MAAVRADHFFLHSRVVHTMKETLRVLRFATICRSLPVSTPSDDPRLHELGHLITASHDSCQYVYNCTRMETDLLHDLCLANGAIGSRQIGRSTSLVGVVVLMTARGGGWGGAIVSLVPVETAEQFMETIRKTYPLYRGLSEKDLDEAAFATLPGSGAGGE